MRLQDYLLKWLDRCLPHGNDHNNRNVAETQVRSRALMGLLLGCLLVTVITLFVFALLSLDASKSFTEAFVLLGAVLLMLSLQILMFYKLGNVGASAIIFSMFFFGGTLGAMILTGGWASPVRELFFCTPIISFLIGGRHEGVYMAFIVLMSGLILLVAQHMQFQPINLTANEDIELIAGIVWVISLVILVICLTVYETLLKVHGSKNSR
jgi:hypothetical protein